jgi:hypothetical protein
MVTGVGRQVDGHPVARPDRDQDRVAEGRSQRPLQGVLPILASVDVELEPPAVVRQVPRPAPQGIAAHDVHDVADVVHFDRHADRRAPVAAAHADLDQRLALDHEGRALHPLPRGEDVFLLLPPMDDAAARGLDPAAPGGQALDGEPSVGARRDERVGGMGRSVDPRLDAEGHVGHGSPVLVGDASRDHGAGLQPELPLFPDTLRGADEPLLGLCVPLRLHAHVHGAVAGQQVRFVDQCDAWVTFGDELDIQLHERVAGLPVFPRLRPVGLHAGEGHRLACLVVHDAQFQDGLVRRQVFVARGPRTAGGADGPSLVSRNGQARRVGEGAGCRVAPERGDRPVGDERLAVLERTFGGNSGSRPRAGSPATGVVRHRAASVAEDRRQGDHGHRRCEHGDHCQRPSSQRGPTCPHPR